MAFDNMGDETDGLMAEGSVRDEQCQINVGALQLSDYRRRELVLDFLMAPDAALKGNVKCGQASHDLLYSEICQSDHRKDDFRILSRHRSNTRVVINHYLTCLGIGRNEPVAQVFTWRKRLLVGEPQCRACHKCDPQFIDRFGYRGPRRQRRRNQYSRRLGRRRLDHDR
jgi:hypothetical protein